MAAPPGLAGEGGVSAATSRPSPQPSTVRPTWLAERNRTWPRSVSPVGPSSSYGLAGGSPATAARPVASSTGGAAAPERKTVRRSAPGCRSRANASWWTKVIQPSVMSS